MPKAGTHLLGKVLSLLPSMMFSGLHLSEEDVFATGVDASPNDFDHDVVVQMIERCRNGQYVTAHFPHAQSLVSLFEESSATPLIIVRDPRDVAVSYVHYVCNEPRHFHHRYFTTELHSFDERLTATLSGFAPGPGRHPGLRPLRDNVQRYLPWVEAGVPLIRFENLIGERGGGTSAAQLHAVHQIAAAVDRPLTDAKAEGVAQRAFAPRARTFRAGQASAWATAFSKHHLDLCSSEVDDLIEAFGYPRTHDVATRTDHDEQ